MCQGNTERAPLLDFHFSQSYLCQECQQESSEQKAEKTVVITKRTFQ
jgi:hypothetical protein